MREDDSGRLRLQSKDFFCTGSRAVLKIQDAWFRDFLLEILPIQGEFTEVISFLEYVGLPCVASRAWPLSHIALHRKTKIKQILTFLHALVWGRIRTWFQRGDKRSEKIQRSQPDHYKHQSFGENFLHLTPSTFQQMSPKHFLTIQTGKFERKFWKHFHSRNESKLHWEKDHQVFFIRHLVFTSECWRSYKQRNKKKATLGIHFSVFDPM